MEVGDDLPQVIAVEVRVDFGGCDGLVAEHILHRTQVGAALNEVRGKGVPKRVRTHVFVDTRLNHCVFDNQKNHHPRELFATGVQKNVVVVAFLRFDVASDEINVYLGKFNGIAADWHQAHFVAFAHHFYKTIFEITVSNL